jgi:hypothetical protein
MGPDMVKNFFPFHLRETGRAQSLNKFDKESEAERLPSGKTFLNT